MQSSIKSAGLPVPASSSADPQGNPATANVARCATFPQAAPPSGTPAATRYLRDEAQALACQIEATLIAAVRMAGYPPEDAQRASWLQVTALGLSQQLVKLLELEEAQ